MDFKSNAVDRDMKISILIVRDGWERTNMENVLQSKTGRYYLIDENGIAIPYKFPLQHS